MEPSHPPRPHIVAPPPEATTDMLQRLWELRLLPRNPSSGYLHGYPLLLRRSCVSSFVDHFQRDPLAAADQMAAGALQHSNSSLPEVSSMASAPGSVSYDHVRFAMEHIGHAFTLPVFPEMSDLISGAIDVYEAWLNPKTCPAILLQSKDQVFIQHIFQHMSCLFARQQKSSNELHLRLCTRVICILLDLVSCDNPCHRSVTGAWETILKLHQSSSGTSDFVSDSCSIPVLSSPQQGPEKMFLCDEAFDCLLRVLLGITDSVIRCNPDLHTLVPCLIRLTLESFLRSATTSKELWEEFQSLFVDWTLEWRCASVLWFDCLEGLLRRMITEMYGPDEIEGRTEVLVSWTLDHLQDGPILIPMQFHHVVFCFHYVFYLHCRPSMIRASDIFFVAVDGLSKLLDLFLGIGQAEPNPPKGLPIPILPHPASVDTLLELFGPRLLDAVDRPEEFGYEAGRALSFRSLCRMFIRRGGPKPRRAHVARFIDRIRQGLGSTQVSVLLAILEECQFLFSFDHLDGILLLAPLFLDEIEIVSCSDRFMSLEFVRLRYASLRILPSLMALPSLLGFVHANRLVSNIFDRISAILVHVITKDRSEENRCFAVSLGSSFVEHLLGQAISSSVPRAPLQTLDEASKVIPLSGNRVLSPRSYGEFLLASCSPASSLNPSDPSPGLGERERSYYQRCRILAASIISTVAESISKSTLDLSTNRFVDICLISLRSISELSLSRVFLCSFGTKRSESALFFLHHIPGFENIEDDQYPPILLLELFIHLAHLISSRVEYVIDNQKFRYTDDPDIIASALDILTYLVHTVIQFPATVQSNLMLCTAFDSLLSSVLDILRLPSTVPNICSESCFALLGNSSSGAPSTSGLSPHHSITQSHANVSSILSATRRSVINSPSASPVSGHRPSSPSVGANTGTGENEDCPTASWINRLRSAKQLNVPLSESLYAAGVSPSSPPAPSPSSRPSQLKRSSIGAISQFIEDSFMRASCAPNSLLLRSLGGNELPELVCRVLSRALSASVSASLLYFAETHDPSVSSVFSRRCLTRFRNAAAASIVPVTVRDTGDPRLLAYVSGATSRMLRYVEEFPSSSSLNMNSFPSSSSSSSLSSNSVSRELNTHSSVVNSSHLGISSSDRKLSSIIPSGPQIGAYMPSIPSHIPLAESISPCNPVIGHLLESLLLDVQDVEKYISASEDLLRQSQNSGGSTLLSSDSSQSAYSFAVSVTSLYGTARASLHRLLQLFGYFPSDVGSQSRSLISLSSLASDIPCSLPHSSVSNSSDEEASSVVPFVSGPRFVMGNSVVLSTLSGSEVDSVTSPSESSHSTKSCQSPEIFPSSYVISRTGVGRFLWKGDFLRSPDSYPEFLNSRCVSSCSSSDIVDETSRDPLRESLRGLFSMPSANRVVDSTSGQGSSGGAWIKFYTNCSSSPDGEDVPLGGNAHSSDLSFSPVSIPLSVPREFTDSMKCLRDDMSRPNEFRPFGLVQEYSGRSGDTHPRILPVCRPACTTPQSPYHEAGLFSARPGESGFSSISTNMCDPFLRLLLVSIGHLSLQGRVGIPALEDSERFHRSARMLDRTSERECWKVGILYVMRGQETQSEILQNTGMSLGFKEFLAGLGLRCSLQHHTGFLGGLDPDGTTGEVSCYSVDEFTEVMFHVAPLMPNTEDSQQIVKKRHVGNDHVHIIWCEADRDYRTYLIRSQFGLVNIIIYPQSKDVPHQGAFLIRIRTKPNIDVPPFGPLIDGSIVSGHLLPDLVRETAVNASRVIRYSQRGFRRPFPTRSSLLHEISERCTEEYFKSSLQSHFGKFFKVNIDSDSGSFVDRSERGMSVRLALEGLEAS